VYDDVIAFEARYVDLRHGAWRGAYLLKVEIDGVYSRAGQGCVENERKMRDGASKFFARGSVPRHDLIEAVQASRISAELDHVESGGWNRTHSIGELNERHIPGRHPNFGVVGTEGLERGKRDDQIANSAGPDD
jgi:hypothetical protein